ncbi:MAG: hypothetical protein ACXWLT_13745 [Rhizomicrobium sp.]
MKVPRALLFSALLLSALGVTAALSQTRTGNDTQRTQVPVVANPFQALGNVLQNPDAVRPPPRRRPGTPPPTIIPR